MRMLWHMRVWKDTRAQDMVEYALVAGCLAAAAGATLPATSATIRSIFQAINQRVSEPASSRL
jgi:Flp pilus assembly pilin Flp